MKRQKHQHPAKPDQNNLGNLMEILNTIRFSFRQMRKRWVLTCAGALSLALCLGLNTAVFSVFNAVLLRPLPFPEPDRVVEVYNTYPQGGVPKASSNIELYTVYKEQVDAIEGFALLRGGAVTFGSEEGAQRIDALRASADFFETMRIVPAIGQPFRPEHGIEGSDGVVLLGYGFWKTAFAGDRNVIGSQIMLNGRSHEIIGVLPESFQRYNANAQILLPYAWDPASINLQRRHLNYATLIGRIAPGATVEQVQAQVDAVDAQYYEDNPEARSFLDRTGHKSVVNRYQEERVASIKPTLYLLNVFALSILIIGALNIANLRLAEVVGRQRELTIRRVMGGSKSQILGQMLVEASVLGVIGGLLGIITAYLSLGLIRNSFSGMVRDVESIQLDGSVLLWTVVLALVTILIVGLSPTRILWRLNYQSLLQEGGRGAASGRGSSLRAGLGIVQTALAVILLIATGLFVRSFWNATTIDPGFKASELHTFRISMPEARYPDESARLAAVELILTGLRNIPGVVNATGATAVPVITGMAYLTFSVLGEIDEEQEITKAADNFLITDEFFETLGIPLLEGRPIEKTDGLEAPEVYVVDRSIEERCLPDGSINARMSFGRPDDEADWATVVGKVPSIIHRELTAVNQPPLVYRSYFQRPQSNISFIIRSKREHESLLADARNVIEDLDENLPLYLTGRMDEMIENSLQERRAILLLTVLFAVVAMLLAIAGIFGVQSYNVSSDIRSIAIRAAVGASPGNLLRRTFTRSLVPVTAGLLAGILLAALLAPRASDHIFAVEARDPVTYSLAAGFILVASAGALVIPARVAARCNPARILHED